MAQYRNTLGLGQTADGTLDRSGAYGAAGRIGRTAVGNEAVAVRIHNTLGNQAVFREHPRFGKIQIGAFGGKTHTRQIVAVTPGLAEMILQNRGRVVSGNSACRNIRIRGNAG